MSNTPTELPEDINKVPQAASQPIGAVWVYTAKGLPKDGTIVLCEYKSGDLSHMEYLDCNKDWWLRNVHRWLDESPTAAGDAGILEQLKAIQISDIDAPVFTHSKEFREHFEYIKKKLLETLSAFNIDSWAARNGYEQWRDGIFSAWKKDGVLYSKDELMAIYRNATAAGDGKEDIDWKAMYEELAQWQREAVLVIDPILEYGQSHPDIKVGQSISTFVIERCKQYDELKAENEALKVIRDSSQENYDELLREHAALKEKADKMADGLKAITELPVPVAGEARNAFNYAVDIAKTALSTYSNKEGDNEK